MYVQRIRIILGEGYRLTVYPEGGTHLEVAVPGIGWCIADDGAWPPDAEVKRLLGCAGVMIANAAEKLA